MEIRYKVIGTHKIGKYVKLLLQPEAAVEVREPLNPLDVAESGDFTKLLEKAQNMAAKVSNDSITLPYEDWERYQIQMNDIIVIDINAEKWIK